MPSFTVAMRVALAVILIASAPILARAEILTLQMPTEYLDYSMHPLTGDLAALSKGQDQVHLYREADLSAKKLEPYARVPVSSSACAICYKCFGKLELFAVICSKEPHIYLINAKDGTLYRKVELEGSDFRSIFSSANPQDPYLYYCFSSGHDCSMGAMNLRSFKSYRVFGDSQDAIVSAQGHFAYRRGPWSPTGFDSLRLDSEFSEEQPKFTSIVDEHRDTGEYHPDPFEQYTITDENIYTATLQRRIAKLALTPFCFFRTKPIIIGMNNEERLVPGVTLRAASYNSFGLIGKPVALKMKSKDPPPEDGDLPGGLGYSASFGTLIKRMRMFPDETRERVVIAFRRRVDLVPLKDFDVPAEPFLLAKFEKPDLAAINGDWTCEVKPFDPAITVEFGALPEGMTVAGKTLKWKPTAAQVGPHKIEVTLKHQEAERTLTLEVSVGYPSLKLPFAPQEFVLNRDGSKILISNVSHGQLDFLNGESTITEGRLMLLETATGKILAERKQSDSLDLAALTPEHAVLIRQDRTSVEVFRLADMEREKAFSLGSDFVSARVFGSFLVMRTNRGGEVYELGTFKKRAVFSASREVSPVSNDYSPLAFLGKTMAIGGVIYNEELKPVFLYDLPGLPTMSGAKPGLQPRVKHLPENPASYSRRAQNQAFRQSEFGPNSSVIEITFRSESGRGQQIFEISIKVFGTEDSQVIFRGPLPQLTSTANYPKLRVAENTAIVVQDRNLYRWTVPANAPPPEKEGEQTLQFELQQSTLALSGTGTTTLKNHAFGGKAPLKYAIRTPYEGIKIDEMTGTVTIDEKALLAETTPAIDKFLYVGNGSPHPYAPLLRERAPEMIALAEKLLGRRPTGIPIAVPLVVEVSDANLQEKLQQYFVLADVPSAPILERLKQLDAAREKPAPAVTNNPGQPAGEVQALQRRLDALEQRLELNTRLLNQLLKSLEQR